MGCVLDSRRVENPKVQTCQNQSRMYGWILRSYIPPELVIRDLICTHLFFN